jgi:flagellar assembly factor FliW
MTAMCAAPAARPTIHVKTLHRGVVEVPEQDLVTFVSPLLGFERLSRFLIYQTQPGPLVWLQSVEDPAAGFCLLDPFAAGLDPDMEISAADIADIGAASASEVTVYTVMVLDKDPAQIRTNLRAPILVGKLTQKAKQVVLADQSLPVRFHMRDLVKRKA